jgi:eukaryotic-like serine/threonine-protein kinase
VVSEVTDRYAIGPELGRGGMGVVHHAVDRETGHRVALKRLAGGHAGDRGFRARFAREVRAMARVASPNVVGIHRSGEDAHGPWFAMDYCAGGSLADRLRHGPMAPSEVRALADDLIAALSAIHTAGLIHRDVKPQNILRDGMRWRVSDFGIALDLTGDNTMTQAGMIIGTPDYLAPENSRDEPVGPQADLYTLGAVLHHALTGAPPYRADSALRLAVLHATAPAPVLPAQMRSADAALARLVEELLRKDPSTRPTAAEARRRLSPDDGAPTLAATPAGAAGPADGTPGAGAAQLMAAIRRSRRPRTRHAVAAAFGAAVLALGAAWIADDDAADDPARTAPATTGAAVAPVVAAPAPSPAPSAAPPPAPSAAPPTAPAAPPVDSGAGAADAADRGDAAAGVRETGGESGERAAGPGNNGRGKAKGHDKKPRTAAKPKKDARE